MFTWNNYFKEEKEEEKLDQEIDIEKIYKFLSNKKLKELNIYCSTTDDGRKKAEINFQLKQKSSEQLSKIMTDIKEEFSTHFVKLKNISNYDDKINVSINIMRKFGNDDKVTGVLKTLIIGQ